MEQARPIPKGPARQCLDFPVAGVGHAQFRAQSVALRTALLEHGWNERTIRPLLTGIDPDALTLF